MRLLFDHNLPHSLARRLAGPFPDSVSLVYLGMSEERDDQVWTTALERSYVLATKDTGFSDSMRFPGPPPKVIIVRSGNCSVDTLESMFRNEAARLIAFGDDRERLITLEPHN